MRSFRGREAGKESSESLSPECMPLGCQVALMNIMNMMNMKMKEDFRMTR
jgi:hypothetical protein